MIDHDRIADIAFAVVPPLFAGMPLTGLACALAVHGFAGAAWVVGVLAATAMIALAGR